MPYQIRLTSSFEAELDKISANYPKSKTDIENFINDLSGGPLQGRAYPGFGSNQVFKTRVPLKSYRLGKSQGLRLIYLVIHDREMIIPLTIYPKKGFGKEQKVIQKIKESLKAVYKEIE